MLDRRANVEQPHPSTCEWILDFQDYQRWVQSSDGLLWIKGKPGAGKSVMMSFLYNRLRNGDQKKDVFFLDFFFNAHGAELQHTPVGMLRSLLNQMFQQDAVNRVFLRAFYDEKCSAFGETSGTWEWQQPELEKVFQQYVALSAQTRTVSLFIDALDEAGEANARHVATYLHSLGHGAGQHSNVKICMSCRHYPILSMLTANEIHMDKNNERDIRTFIQDRLKMTTMHLSSSQQNEQWSDLGSMLIKRAQGIFMWVRIVILMIEKAISEGESLAEVKTWIWQVPDKLVDIYRQGIRGIISKGQQAQSLSLFIWVCLSVVPMTVQKLQYAMVAKDFESNRLRARVGDTPTFGQSPDAIARKVRTLSAGLLELVPGDYETQVQVIHQTVSDYLLDEGYAMLSSSLHQNVGMRIEVQSSTLVAQFNAMMYWSCLNFLASLPRRISPLSDRNMYLFTCYASTVAFDHAERADDERVVDTETEIRILRGVRDLILPMKTGWRCAETDSLLCAAIDHNLADLVKGLVHRGEDVAHRDSEGCTPLHHAAASSKEVAIFEVLFEAGADLVATDSSNETPLQVAVACHNHTAVEWLLSVTKSQPSDYVMGEILIAAARTGDDIVFQRLLDFGVHIDFQDTSGCTALQEAAIDCNLELCEYIIERGATTAGLSDLLKLLRNQNLNRIALRLEEAFHNRESRTTQI